MARFDFPWVAGVSTASPQSGAGEHGASRSRPRPTTHLQRPVSRETPHAPAAIVPLTEFLERHEIAYIKEVLKRTGGNVTQAARLLGTARSALHRRMRQLGISSPASGE